MGDRSLSCSFGFSVEESRIKVGEEKGKGAR